VRLGILEGGTCSERWEKRESLFSSRKGGALVGVNGANVRDRPDNDGYQRKALSQKEFVSGRGNGKGGKPGKIYSDRKEGFTRGYVVQESGMQEGVREKRTKANVDLSGGKILLR